PQSTAAPARAPLPLHDALPIGPHPRPDLIRDGSPCERLRFAGEGTTRVAHVGRVHPSTAASGNRRTTCEHWSSRGDGGDKRPRADRKSTRLNSSHVKISYAVFC